MCGICGFFISGRRSGGNDLEAMSQALIHRGPDDSGYYFKSLHGQRSKRREDYDIGLAHRRLSIIDLSAQAHQPMFNEDRTIVLAFNGEIYNFADLKKELEENGHKFISKTDSEVIIHGYEQWGTDLLEKMNGMFAFALFDRKAGELILARDRVGIKPLYYYSRSGVFLFGSEITALKKHPFFDAAVDPRSLARYLSFSYVPAPGTIYRHTYKLLPGEFLVVKNGSTQKKKYWDLMDRIQDYSQDICFDRARDRCEELLLDAVKLRLVSDVPLGAFLSGGYDSSLVVALMKEAGARNIQTFTIGFNEAGYNEAPQARDIARYLGTHHHEYILTSGEAVRALQMLSSIYDEPFGDYSALPTYLVSQLARQNGMKVTLSGDGGDELFRGYTRYASSAKLMALNSMPAAARRLCGGAFRLLPAARMKRLALNMNFNSLAGFYHFRMSTWKKGIPEGLVRLNSTDNEPDSKTSRIYQNYNRISEGAGHGDIFKDIPFYKTFSRTGPLDGIQAMSLTDIHTYMVDDILTKVDRASMAVSLETRVPLLDHRLVEFAASLPSHLNFHGGSGKYLLKNISGKFIPPGLLERPKRGFSIPVIPWLRGPMRESLKKELDREKIASEGLLDANKVSEVLSGFFEGRYQCGRLIWSLFMFELWFKNHESGDKGEALLEREKAQNMHVDSQLLSACRRG